MIPVLNFESIFTPLVVSSHKNLIKKQNLSVVNVIQNGFLNECILFCEIIYL